MYLQYQETQKDVIVAVKMKDKISKDRQRTKIRDDLKLKARLWEAQQKCFMVQSCDCGKWRVIYHLDACNRRHTRW